MVGMSARGMKCSRFSAPSTFALFLRYSPRVMSLAKQGVTQSKFVDYNTCSKKHQKRHRMKFKKNDSSCCIHQVASESNTLKWRVMTPRVFQYGGNLADALKPDFSQRSL